MVERRDALAGAAEIVLAIERAAKEEPAGTVATAGTLTVTPGAISVIPGQARIGVDMRGIDGSSLDRLQRITERGAAEIGRRRNVSVQTVLTRTGDPVELDPAMVSAGLAAAKALNIAARTTWSGAGHDAQHLSSLTRALLVFVPLHGGESHTPHEGAELNEIVHAAMLVAYVLRKIGA
jgi:acetylornithine deacetylase/succinyl-diaminopimelate desuccinylase-like protein